MAVGVVEVVVDTGGTTVKSGSLAGAEITTFFAPASSVLLRTLTAGEKSGRLDEMSSRARGHCRRVSSTRSLISWPPATQHAIVDNDLALQGAEQRIELQQVRIVAASPRSLAATISKSALRARAARKKLRRYAKAIDPTRVFVIGRHFTPPAGAKGRGNASARARGRCVFAYRRSCAPNRPLLSTTPTACPMSSKLLSVCCAAS